MITYKHLFTNPIGKFAPDGGFTSIFRTIGFIGDSLSSGEHESLTNGERGYHDYYEYSWGQYIGRKCGLTAYNFSRGGLTCMSFLNDYVPNVNDPFVEEKKCQAYVIALGVNDMSHIDGYKDGFGSMKDVDLNDESNNKESYVGYYVRIIQKLRKLEPKCRIFVMVPPKEHPETKEKKEKRVMIQKFLNELPNYFEFLYVLDLRKYAPTYSRKFGKKYFLGGHMSAAGYKFTGDMVATYIDYYIRKFPQDFAQVGFIGRGIHNENAKW